MAKPTELPRSLGPWLCAGAVVIATILGLLGEEVLDVAAGILFLVPTVIVFNHLRRRH